MEENSAFICKLTLSYTTMVFFLSTPVLHLVQKLMVSLSILDVMSEIL
jgi:hypothetical protein